MEELQAELLHIEKVEAAQKAASEKVIAAKAAVTKAEAILAFAVGARKGVDEAESAWVKARADLAAAQTAAAGSNPHGIKFTAAKAAVNKELAEAKASAKNRAWAAQEVAAHKAATKNMEAGLARLIGPERAREVVAAPQRRR